MPDLGHLAPAGADTLAVRGLHAGYGGRLVLRDVTFSTCAGQRIAVLGPNGGGKTTLFRVLLGQLRPVHGSHTAPRCAVVPQTERSRLDYPVSALDVAVMGSIGRLPWWRRPGRAEREAALDALRSVGLETLAGASFGALSGGQRQRVLVARALVQDARVLLLDEPFTGLDTVSAERLEQLLSTLAERGHTLLIATHDVVQASRWERVLCLNERQLAFGAPADVLTRDVLEATYGQALVPLGDGERVVVPAHHHDAHA
jgi:ABC-type Mn2+/Zn2+ transport system ATPase subunit